MDAFSRQAGLAKEETDGNTAPLDTAPHSVICWAEQGGWISTEVRMSQDGGGRAWYGAAPPCDVLDTVGRIREPAGSPLGLQVQKASAPEPPSAA